jgi:predicted TPR repeat methyltransferase
MTKKYLDQAYDLQTQDATNALYDQWAASYDAEVRDNGYATPGRCAKALFEHLPEPQAPVLDYGCGTGLSGLALKLGGFNLIDGLDPSPEMLDGARAKNIYRNLSLLDLSNKTPIGQGSYKAIAAIGVIGIGAAPVETLDLLLQALNTGGLLTFSYNDHALADPKFEARLDAWITRGAARILFKEYGPHLPQQGIKSNVYIVERM